MIRLELLALDIIATSKSDKTELTFLDLTSFITLTSWKEIHFFSMILRKGRVLDTGWHKKLFC